jgi:acetamidase/formamidase
VKGGGIYLGDMHALQGDGEIAGHTCDVAGIVTLQVNLMKGLALDGPIIFPLLDDLPYLAKPLSPSEYERASHLARQWGQGELEKSAPISFVGTGANLNSATDNGLARAASVLAMSIPEVKNRATITGGIEIGRHPGVVQVTLRAPLNQLDQRGLLPFVREQYGLVA